MSDDFEQQEWFKFGMAATLSRQYASDQRAMLELLAQMLESALPDEAEIIRKGGLFARKTVQRVSVQIGADRYSLEDPGRGPLHATRTRVVRNIALKTEDIPVQEWLSALGSALDDRARESKDAREALSRLIG